MLTFLSFSNRYSQYAPTEHGTVQAESCEVKIIANEQPTHSDSIPEPYATNEEQHVQADVHEQRALVETSPKVTDKSITVPTL